MKIAITGGTGFIGSRLVEYFTQLHDEVILISRSCKLTKNKQVQCITWDQLDTQINQLEGLDALINFAGESINQKWTDEAKNRILHSRIDATRHVARVVDRLLTKPQVVINGSAMSVYGTSDTEVFDEDSPSREMDFLSSVIKEWESAADSIADTRVVKLRTGLVIGRGGAAISKMATPYRLGVGGRVGTGQQWYSWIHIDDIVQMIMYCIEHEDIHGAVNATAPNPVRNNDFGRAIGKVLHRPHYFPVPVFVFKSIFGEMSDLILKGQQVMPRVLLNHGFQFTYPEIETALQQILASEKQD